LGRGGALETVIDGETGVLVPDATVDAFAAVLERFGRLRFDPVRARINAERFSRPHHVDAMRAVIAETLAAAPGQRW
jgi:glycosyltransferase involved in cell wall biosynthesis